jgi:hypothetical protein
MRDKPMIKSLTQTFVTGATLLVAYLLYFVVSAILTFIIGFPIGIGIYTIVKGLELLFNGV